MKETGSIYLTIEHLVVVSKAGRSLNRVRIVEDQGTKNIRGMNDMNPNLVRTPSEIMLSFPQRLAIML